MSEVLSVIQGDTFAINLTVGGADAGALEKITFSCRDQNIVQDFIKLDEGVYALEIGSDKTKKFTPKVSSFDITGIFIDGEKVTASYHNRLLVLRKENNV